MSTRCQIGIYEKAEQDIIDPNVLIYRHSDGYPDSEHGVVADLLPFLKAFHKERGMSDVMYLGAWLVYHLIAKYSGNESDPNKYRCLGHGIDFPGRDGFHVDIEYFYFIAPGLLRVYSIDGWDTEPGDKSWSIIEEYVIE